LLLVASLAKSQTIDDIVKKSIAEAAPQNAKAMPRIVETSDLDEPQVKVKSKKDCPCGPGCTCGPDCKCPGKCKPGCKCESCNGKVSKSGSAAPVERCYVIIDDVKIFTIEEMTAAEATAAIRAQGSKVVFIDHNNTVVDPPSWYTGKVALSHSMVQQKYQGVGVSVTVGGPAYQTAPVYQVARSTRLFLGLVVFKQASALQVPLAEASKLGPASVAPEGLSKL
jgi:hypothetical protein